MKFAAAALALASVATARVNEVWTREQEDNAGINRGYVVTPEPHTYVGAAEIPAEFTWCDRDGVNYCTMSRNQHIPAYCGSCWAHGALSALADRIKIQRGAKGIDINLSVQHMLNCGNAGSCHGGSVIGPYSWMHDISRSGTGIAYEDANVYQACSSESREGLCKYGDYTCGAHNLRAKAYTCSTFESNGGFCAALSQYPNATVAEYGEIYGASKMQAEIYARGPISCGIDAAPITKYTGGIARDSGRSVDHVVSVVGWGQENGESYWIVRNSWGTYWGENGYVRVQMGNNALKLESQCAWAVPGTFTESNFPCFEDGTNCK